MLTLEGVYLQFCRIVDISALRYVACFGRSIRERMTIINQADDEQNSPVAWHYYVDEAGDGTLFNAKGKVMVGQDGCSRFFIAGLLLVHEPERLANELTDLRLQLMADPYFANIPSMQAERRKTALMFHAKDDIPEVRREVYKLLHSHQVSFFAVIKDKHKVLDYVRQRNERDPGGYRYQQNELYDLLIRRLFKDRLHQNDNYRVTFATRGGADRTRALANALETAKQGFAEKWGRTVTSNVEVISCNPQRTVPLQAVDYFLWALQRLYERGEGRYWDYVWPQVSLVIDMDDTEQAKYGRYYTQKKPLTLAAVKSRLEI